MPTLERSFAQVLVLLTRSTRYHGPQPIKRFQRIVLLIYLNFVQSSDIESK